MDLVTFDVRVFADEGRSYLFGLSVDRSYATDATAQLHRGHLGRSCNHDTKQMKSNAACLQGCVCAFSEISSRHITQQSPFASSSQPPVDISCNVTCNILERVAASLSDSIDLSVYVLPRGAVADCS